MKDPCHLSYIRTMSSEIFDPQIRLKDPSIGAETSPSIRKLVAVVGASGKLGRRVVARLVADGAEVLALGRNIEKLADLGTNYRVADINNRTQLQEALNEATHLVSCAHARFVPAITQALGPNIERIVFLGSTRRYTKFPDKAAREVEQSQNEFDRLLLPGVMLHPTMIYGADGENNVQRISQYLRRIRIVPLPRGGRSLVQPIHVDDVVSCVVSALHVESLRTSDLVIAGPSPMTYRQLIATIGSEIGRTPIFISIPVGFISFLSFFTRYLPGLPTIRKPEVMRLLEDKAFETTDMVEVLGVVPRPLAEGLRSMLAFD